MHQVTKNVYAETEIRGCNPGIVFTREGAVFIDTPQLITNLLEMRSFALERGPIKALINTEAHIDHIFGNHWFYGECPLIAHERLIDAFWKVPPAFNASAYGYVLDVIERQDPAGLPFMPAEKDYIVYTPTVTFSDKLFFKMGDHEFRLYYTPGHSPSNISVFIPQERVVFVADTVFQDCQIWLHTADFDELFKSLNFISTLDVDYIIPGHGPVIRPSELKQQTALLHDWLSTVAAAIAKGWDQEECVKRISLADRCPMDVGQDDAMDYVQTCNVRVVYDYLMKNH